MEPGKLARDRNPKVQKPRADRAGEYRSSESDCARAMAQAKSVLREISLMRLYARRTGRELPNPVSEQAESAIPDFATVGETKPYTHSHPPAVQFGVFDLRLAKAIPDHFTLDPDLDFVVHNDGGAIELTETGFRRMVQAHSAGFDIVIGVDRRDVLRFPARSFADGSMR